MSFRTALIPDEVLINLCIFLLRCNPPSGVGVTSSDVSPSVLTSSDVPPSVVTSSDVSPSVVTSSDVSPSVVTRSDVSPSVSI